jgi:hypothetical protein
MFQISPKLQFLYPYNGKGDQNYCYMNTKKIIQSDHKQGIGFGGKDFDDWKLWIDNDIKNESRACWGGDKTYDTGLINEGITEKLQIQTLEFWGLGGRAADEAQMKHFESKSDARKSENQRIKEGLIGNKADREMLFGKTFAHQADVRADVQEDNDKKMDERWQDK